MMKNTPTLSLRVPEPLGRPGDTPDFSHLKLDAAGVVTRPEVSTAPYEMRDHAFQLVRVLDEAPWVSRIAGAHHVELGGFTLSGDGKRLVVVATEDNLLKGAATQALQNLNMAFGLDEFLGIPL